MSSKLSSGSLVKSVESILPKGVNLKHVLLAVLVGLLLCMMFGQTVEGYTCTMPPLPPGYAVIDGQKGITFPVGTPGEKKEIDPTTITDWSPGGKGEMTYDKASTVYECTQGYTGKPTLTCDTGKSAPARFGGCDTKTPHSNGGGGTTFPSCGTQMIPGPVSLEGKDDKGPKAGAPCKDYCENDTVVGSQLISSAKTFGILPDLWGGNSNMASLILTDPNDQGFCSPPSGAAAIEENECYSKLTSGDCESEANNCSWKSFKDYLDENSTLPKKWYIPIMTLLGVYKPGCTDPIKFKNEMLSRTQTTTILDIYTSTDGPGGADSISGLADGDYTGASQADKNGWKGLKTKNDSNYYDFFRLLLGSEVDKLPQGSKTKDKVSDLLQKSNSNRVPPAFRDLLLPYVQIAEDVWKMVDPKGEVLKLNGGRVIFGYNETDGLVFRNNPLHNYSVNTSDSKFHVGLGCPGTTTISDGDIVAKNDADDVSCHDDSPCDISQYTGNDEWGFLTGIRFTAPGTYCQLKSCRNDKKLTECGANKVASDFTERAGEGGKKLFRQVASMI